MLVVSTPLPYSEGDKLNYTTLVQILKEKGTSSRAVWTNHSGSWHAEFRDVDEKLGQELVAHFTQWGWIPTIRWQQTVS